MENLKKTGENKQKTDVEYLTEVLEIKATHLTPEQLANYAAFLKAASKVGLEDHDWILTMMDIIIMEAKYASLPLDWEEHIIKALKNERNRLTPQQLNDYIALVKAASKAAPENYWLNPVLMLIEKGLGYALPMHLWIMD